MLSVSFVSAAAPSTADSASQTGSAGQPQKPEATAPSSTTISLSDECRKAYAMAADTLSGWRDAIATHVPDGVKSTAQSVGDGLVDVAKKTGVYPENEIDGFEKGIIATTTAVLGTALYVDRKNPSYAGKFLLATTAALLAYEANMFYMDEKYQAMRARYMA